MTLPASGSKISLGDIKTEMAVTASPFTLASAEGEVYARINRIGAHYDLDQYPAKISEFSSYNHTSASTGCGRLYDGMIMGTWNILGTGTNFVSRWFNGKWWFVQETYGGPGWTTTARRETGSFDAFLGRGSEMLLRTDFTLRSASYGEFTPCYAWVSSSYGGLYAPDTGTLPPPKYYQYVYDAANDFWQYSTEFSLPATGSVQTITTGSEVVKFLSGVTGSYSYSVELGTGYGDVTLTYNTGEQPDKFRVIYNGSEVINTKFRGNPIHNRALYVRGFLPVTGSIDGKGTAVFSKLTTASTAYVIVNSPIGNTDFGFTISEPVKVPNQQTVTVYAKASGSVAPTQTNPKIYYNIINDIYASTLTGYLTGSLPVGSTYVNMGSVTLSSGSSISFTPNDSSGSGISSCNTIYCTGSFGCGSSTYDVGSDMNVYLTLELDSTGSFVSCLNAFGPGIYYTLTGV